MSGQEYNTSISVLTFVEETKRSLDSFLVNYLQKHQENPEFYPLSIPIDNSGCWMEWFLDSGYLQENGIHHVPLA